MQIKINLDQIFGVASTEDPSNISHFQSYQPSESGSAYSYNNQYRMNVPIFDDFQSQSQKSVSKSQQSKAPSSVTNKSQFYDKNPGERLYYQSKNNFTKKKQQHERVRLEKLMQEQKQATFKPKINRNTQKILSNKNKNTIMSKKRATQILPTHLKKQQEQIIHCTFKPQLIAKSASGAIRYREKEKLFEELFNDHKLKEVRLKLKTEENEPFAEKKKLTKQQFQNFLTRNNEFMSKVQKKNELILSTSKKFDLQTGNKLFSPKTNTFKPHKNYFSNKMQQKLLSPVSSEHPVSRTQIKTKGIFSKNYDQYEQGENSFNSNSVQWMKMNQIQDAHDKFQNFREILEAKLDQQEQIAQQQQSYHAVNAFQIKQQHCDGYKDNYSKQANEGDKLQKNKGDYQIQSLKNSDIKSLVEHKDFLQSNQHYQEESESPIRNELEKNSDTGRTHHEGESSNTPENQ